MTIKEEVLACIVEALSVEEELPDDIDPSDLADKLNVTRRTAYERMRKCIKNGETFAGHHLKETVVATAAGNRKTVFRIIDP